MIDPIIGIDLGTTNSVVAVADEQGAVRVLSDDKGFKIQPSVVSFHPNGSVVVGAEAKQRRVIDPANTIYSAKRLIGRAFDSPEVAAAMERMPYVIKQGSNQQPVIATRAGELAIPEISAILLDHLRNLAGHSIEIGAAAGPLSRRRASVGLPTSPSIDRAVVTVPANFTDAQRAATANSGAICGLEIPQVLNEPTAAALAYGHKRSLKQIIAVYDFGGGTFDVTILKLDDKQYEVLGTAGNSFLGGDDIDERVVDAMVSLFLKQQRVDLRHDQIAMQRLRQVAEQIKVELSRRNRAIVTIDEIAYGPGGKPMDLHLEMSRDELIAQAAGVVDRTFPVCEQAVRLAGLKTDDISDIVLVGGTTKMPYVRERVARYFGKPPRIDINPDEAVAMGAALQGMALRQILGPSKGKAKAKARPQVAQTGTARPGVAVSTEVDRPSPIPPGPRASTQPQPFVSSLPPKTQPGVGPGIGPGFGSELGLSLGPGGAASPQQSSPAPVEPSGGEDTTQIELPESTGLHRLGEAIAPVAVTGEVLGKDTALSLPKGVRAPPKSVHDIDPLGSGTGELDLKASFSEGPTLPSDSDRFPQGVERSERGNRSAEIDAFGPRDFTTGAFGTGNATTNQLDRKTSKPFGPGNAATNVATNVTTNELDLGATQPKAPKLPGRPREPDLPASSSPRGLTEALDGLDSKSTELDLDELARQASEALDPELFSTSQSSSGEISEHSIELDLAALAADAADAVDDFEENVETKTAIKRPASAQASPPAGGNLGGFEDDEESIELDPRKLVLPAPPPSVDVPAQGGQAAPPAQQQSPAPYQPPGPSGAPSPLSAAPNQATMAMQPPAAAPGQPTMAMQPPAAAPQAPAHQVPIVLDVIPHSLGIGTVAGYCEELVRQNTRLPMEIQRAFTTSKNHQRTVRIQVCQGESRRLHENVILGDIVLDGLEPRLRGETEIIVTFQVDASGILHVRATDSRTGMERDAYLNAVGGQSPEDFVAASNRFQQIRG